MLVKIIVIAISGALIVGCADQNNGSKARRHRGLAARSAHVADDYSSKTDTFAFYGEDISTEKEQELLAESVVYFGYDKDELTDRYQLVLLAHAKNLMENPGLKLRIDGHTDERGSAEYNVGLGERRAKTVDRFIAFKGIPKDRLVAVSYGKEQPAVHGHNEEAWRMNRRVELAYE